MVLVVVVAVAALTLAVSTGHGPQLARLRLRAVRLLVVAAVAQIATAVLAPDSEWARTGSLVLTGLLATLFLGRNLTVRGVPLVALGLLLNGLVIVANGAMPVSMAAVKAAGLTDQADQVRRDPMREVLGDSTRLPLLADRIAVPAPGWSQVVSTGDVLVASGTGLLLIAGSVPQPSRRGARRRQPARRLDRSMALAMESTTRGSYS